MTHRSLVPALGVHWLTRFYDPLIALTLRERTLKAMGNRMEMVRDWCEGRGDVKFIEPAKGAGICFVRLPAWVESMEFCERLIDEYKTMIVPGDFYLAPGHVRISTLPKKEMIETGLRNAGLMLDKMKADN